MLTHKEITSVVSIFLNKKISLTFLLLCRMFLASANEVSTGPTCQKVDVGTRGVCALYFRSLLQGI